jgi:hypothetical protein
MKNMFKLSLGIVLAASLLSGCGFHAGMTRNVNNSNTQVELSRKNFKVLERVSATSTNIYIMGFGGLANKSLIEKAKQEMYAKANLAGSAKAIVDITVEEHQSIITPLYRQKTVTVSGHVIEFTE